MNRSRAVRLRAEDEKTADPIAFHRSVRVCRRIGCRRHRCVGSASRRGRAEAEAVPYPAGQRSYTGMSKRVSIRFRAPGGEYTQSER